MGKLQRREQHCIDTVNRNFPSIAYRDVVFDDLDAEQLAVSWLRRFGHSDARLTRRGPDNGIDVWAKGAVAQVKHWTDKRVGIAEVQRLGGTAMPGQRRYFFSSSGYTESAARWAEAPDCPVALFRLRRDGNIMALNHMARKALWDAPYHDVKPRNPGVSWLFGIPLSLFILCGTTLDLLLMVVYITRGRIDLIGLMLVIGPLAAYIAGFVYMFRLYMMPVAKKISFFRKSGEWPGWRAALSVAPDLPAASQLAPDLYAGYHVPWVIRWVDRAASLNYLLRALRRYISVSRRLDTT